MSPKPRRLLDRARGAATERLSYKAAAVLLAVVLWIAVRARDTVEQMVPAQFAPRVDSAASIASAPPALRVMVAGRASELLKLLTNPPVIRPIIGDRAGDSVRVALRPADVELPDGVDARVRDVQPRVIWVRVSRP